MEIQYSISPFPPKPHFSEGGLLVNGLGGAGNSEWHRQWPVSREDDFWLKMVGKRFLIFCLLSFTPNRLPKKSRSHITEYTLTCPELFSHDPGLLQHPDEEIAEWRVVFAIFEDVALMFVAAAR